jgi:prefoldin subunit 5
MSDRPERRTNDSSYLLQLPQEDKDEFSENTENMAETMRRLIRSYNEVGGGYDIEDDLDRISVVILKTYRNAIQQNIQLMESQLDKIEEELEKYEEEEEHNDEVLVEIDLDVATKNL